MCGNTNARRQDRQSPRQDNVQQRGCLRQQQQTRFQRATTSGNIDTSQQTRTTALQNHEKPYGFYLSDVLIEKNVHICGLSERWLYPHNLHFLNALSMNNNVYAKCDKDLCVTSAKGAGKGGVALLWHKQLDHVVSPLPIDEDRLIVYLPCSNHTSLIFRDYIDKLYDLWCNYSQWGTVVFLGDFNAKYTADSPVTRASHSYVSYDDSCQTLIDFICIPAEIVYTCTHCEMIDDNCLNTSRHRPVLCTLKLGDTISESNYTNADVNLQINWNKTRPEHISEYNTLLQDDTELNNIIHSELGIDSIDNAYDIIRNKLNEYSSISLPRKKFVPNLKPYWNQELSDLHSTMTSLRVKWCSEGRPRSCNNKYSADYKNAKRRFRRLHRKSVNTYLTTLDMELDNAAELDQKRV
ncbi:hypothetical protein MAR_036028 [Mya arenaria]|uniref:Endonuclease/exonuclease/phosphatase domain-containing protein n=1 Tax=Mya arenaria TaxID=6604 RepID=A0ABY7EPF8_MYAAR|nr:hypothetical protein MAR_036028 [Mya arenaria]